MNRLRLSRPAFTVLAALLIAAPVAGAERLPSQAILRAVRRSVFEVVVPKPEHDPLTYEKPLPLDLIPFKIRNDKYHSVGSAFAINDSLLVTAAHVLRLNYRTQLGPHRVRDANGAVYQIRTVVAFSSYRDIAVFTIDRKAPLAPLPVRREYALNQSVFAVGNALGDGIVIRDGLLTSTTPEPEQGLFQYLRFSAAASPGNSGGPLLDPAGRAIGVVTLKSDNENLNYGLPISEVLALLGRPAEVYNRVIYALPNCNYQKIGVFRGSLDLPQSQEGLRQALSDRFVAHSRALMDSLLLENRDKYFPVGRNSQTLLHSLYATNFPNVVAQGKDDAWSAFGPREVQTAQLGDNGVLHVASDMFGYEFFQLVAPDSVPLARYHDDDRLLMDHLLTGFTLNRTIGSSKTRIVSLGASADRGLRTDAYGRTWLVRSWLIPYSDQKAVVYALPVPMGLVGFLRIYNLGHFDSGILPDMEHLADHIYLSYYGTLSRWAEFLRTAPLPERLRSITLSYAPGRELALATPRLSLRTTPAVLPISDRSDLQLRFSYFRDGDAVVWDVAGIQVGESKDNGNVVTIKRHGKPGADVSEGLRTDWQKIAYQQYPYDQTPGQSDDGTQINGLHPAYKRDGPAQKLGRPVLYTTSVSIEGKQDDGDMRSKLKKFNNGITILEQ